MRRKILDAAINDLLAITPSIRRSLQRKLVKTAFNQIEVNISLPHMEIMRILQEEDTLHIAEIGERLQIPKPQMSQLIDRLVELTLVRREPEPLDRRIINIALTEKGRHILEEFDQAIRGEMAEKLDRLTDAELREVSVSLRKIYELFARL